MRRFRSLLVAVTLIALGVSASPASAAGAGATYLVMYNQPAIPQGAEAAITQAGGKLVYAYREIGVAVVVSPATGFAATLRKDSNVAGVSATAGFASQLEDAAGSGAAAAPAPTAAAVGGDTLSGLQWDMEQIQAPAARAINPGSSGVVVGDIDTGLDYTHVDLAPNVDFSRSVSCLGGVPNTNPSAWMDDNGHGTHTAGTIAAAQNGVGIVGVAPNVKIAGIKAGDANGYFYPEAAVCAFMWAGSHGITITNNSYFVDPWLFNCKNDPDQRVIWASLQRAIRWAMNKGVTVIASAGNFADDLAHPTQDVTSPDDTVPSVREISNACGVIPVEIPGVIGVSANGNTMLKSYYSNYGVGKVQVVAPGGDSRLGITAAAPNGRVLSTYPASTIWNCARPVFEGSATYCYLQGTSMAGPHAAGVAALIQSQDRQLKPGPVAARLQSTADPITCPSDLSIYDFFPGRNSGTPQSCQGGAGNNGFYGRGQVNALRALTNAR